MNDAEVLNAMFHGDEILLVNLAHLFLPPWEVSLLYLLFADFTQHRFHIVAKLVPREVAHVTQTRRSNFAPDLRVSVDAYAHRCQVNDSRAACATIREVYAALSTSKRIRLTRHPFRDVWALSHVYGSQCVRRKGLAFTLRRDAALVPALIADTLPLIVNRVHHTVLAFAARESTLDAGLPEEIRREEICSCYSHLQTASPTK